MSHANSFLSTLLKGTAADQLRTMKKISILLLALVMLFSSSLAFGKEKVSISCSEQDAKIFADGVLVGNGTAKIIVYKGECLNLKIVKAGFVTVEKNYCVKGGNSLPDKDFIKMEVDEAYISSVSTQIANTDFVIKVENLNAESWKTLSSIILSYFDVIELADKETSYLRTAWSTQVFNAAIVRTRVIVKGDPNGYKVKLVSENSYPTAKQKESGLTDESYRQWSRILRKYETLIIDLQARLR
jgi:hypothetical protein